MSSASINTNSARLYSLSDLQLEFFLAKNNNLLQKQITIQVAPNEKMEKKTRAHMLASHCKIILLNVVSCTSVVSAATAVVTAPVANI